MESYGAPGPEQPPKHTHQLLGKERFLSENKHKGSEGEEQWARQTSSHAKPGLSGEAPRLWQLGSVLNKRDAVPGGRSPSPGAHTAPAEGAEYCARRMRAWTAFVSEPTENLTGQSEQGRSLHFTAGGARNRQRHTNLPQPTPTAFYPPPPISVLESTLKGIHQDFFFLNKLYGIVNNFPGRLCVVLV